MESRTIRSCIEELRPLSRWARETSARYGCPPGVCDDLDLCLHEAVVNVILHGYGKRAPGQITVEIERGVSVLRVSIEDGAHAFDPTSMPLPEPVPLQRSSSGGRGLVLIRSLAPTIRYERRTGLNRLTLEFGLPGP
jgi:anti-sigma regulatory factor (Ser/Thr protein kinase)